MARLMSRSRRLAAMAVLMSLPALSMAADQVAAPGAGDRQQKPASTQTMDVRDLNTNISQFIGQRVSVAGEIEDKPGPRALILESGGIFDDEILVIVPNNARGMRAPQLQEDADIVITGTVRSMSLIDVERELGWDLEPELEVELEGTRNFLVADQITRKRE